MPDTLCAQHFAAWTELPLLTTDLFSLHATPERDAQGRGLSRRRPFAEWFGSGLDCRAICDECAAMHDATEPGTLEREHS